MYRRPKMFLEAYERAAEKALRHHKENMDDIHSVCLERERRLDLFPRMLGMLKDLQWDKNHTCTKCGSQAPYQLHAETCILDRLIQEAERRE